jgi:hypothetical protein
MVSTLFRDYRRNLMLSLPRVKMARRGKAATAARRSGFPGILSEKLPDWRMSNARIAEAVAVMR